MNHRWLIWLIFFLSGFAGLVYQVVWMRMLTPVLGCTVYATATVVGSFMLGFALGSHIAGRSADGREDLLRVYCFLELGIGLSALVLSHTLGWLTPVYRAVWQITDEPGWTTAVVRFTVVFAILLVPTTLMGATLPVMNRFLNREATTFGANLGWLYGINTLGAVFGSLASGFVLIAWFGQYATVLVAVSLNLLVGIIAWRMHVQLPRHASVSSDFAQPISGYSPAVRRLALACFFLSGSTALTYEVIWTRWLQLLVGTSVYAFTTILVLFLIGIALGSTVLGSWSDRLRNPLACFGWTQLLIAAWGLTAMVWFGPLKVSGAEAWFGSELLAGLKAGAVVVLPITVAFGWLFPIASRCCARTVSEMGASVGTAYAVNTIGCAFGSLAAGFALIPYFGSARSLVLLSCVNVIVGMLLLAQAYHGRVRQWTLVVCSVAVVALGAGFFAVPHWDPYLNALRKTHMNDDNWRIYSHVETAAATVTAFGPSRNPAPFWKQLLVNGAGMTSLTTDTKLMAHLPLLMVPKPKRMLVICFGMGTTLRSASRYDGLSVTGVELVDGVVSMFPFFHLDARAVLSQPNVNVRIDDGRNFLLTHDEPWDVITIDPAPPIHSAGTVNLYTKEFLELCRGRLTDQGVTCLWVPAWIDSEIRMILRTFLEVFPDATVWSGPIMPGFYLIGGHRDRPVIEARLDNLYQNPVLVADLVEWDNTIESPQRLLALRLGDHRGLALLADRASIITDDHPYTEFPLWRVLRGPQPPPVLDSPVARARLAQAGLGVDPLSDTERMK